MKSYLAGRHETVNSRFKNFSCMKEVFWHTAINYIQLAFVVLQCLCNYLLNMVIIYLIVNIKIIKVKRQVNSFLY